MFSWDILGFQEYVFWFEVSMGDSVIMQLLDSLADLQDALEAILLVHFVVLAEVESIPCVKC